MSENVSISNMDFLAATNVEGLDEALGSLKLLKSRREKEKRHGYHSESKNLLSGMYCQLRCDRDCEKRQSH